MKFEWDPHKNATNLQKHGLDFADVHLVFKYPMLVRLDVQQDYGRSVDWDWLAEAARRGNCIHRTTSRYHPSNLFQKGYQQ
jgi:uncharacterized DUF497 family protein